MANWSEFLVIVPNVYEVVNKWAKEYIYDIEGIKCNYSTVTGYIETRNTSIYLEDLIELGRRLKELGVRIEIIESAGVDDEGLLIWLSKL